MFYDADEGQVGIAYLSEGEATFTLPALPATRTELATGPILATIGICSATDDDPSACSRSPRARAPRLPSATLDGRGR